ncbi:hypothetical protein R75461_04786 [Paraburkholderia nemoris]|nr:hypothetical protein LMG22931_00047 [Paraburkholderia nemoris]CAE6792230.1 hypothetical protein R75461_04786 [Paraburkholderia nemoris]
MISYGILALAPGKAGVRLGIGSSSVSRNVQKLEAQLDARLQNGAPEMVTII